MVKKELPLEKEVAYTGVIKTPKAGDAIEQDIMVEGNFSGALPDQKHLWLLVNPIGSSGWWPQNGEITPDLSKGSWIAQVKIGSDKDVSRRFNIMFVAANEETHKSFVEYLNDCKQSGKYPELPLPGGLIRLANVIVSRK